MTKKREIGHQMEDESLFVPVVERLSDIGYDGICAVQWFPQGCEYNMDGCGCNKVAKWINDCNTVGVYRITILTGKLKNHL